MGKLPQEIEQPKTRPGRSSKNQVARALGFWAARLGIIVDYPPEEENKPVGLR
jgi:hypothetical protein